MGFYGRGGEVRAYRFFWEVVEASLVVTFSYRGVGAVGCKDVASLFGEYNTQIIVAKICHRQ